MTKVVFIALITGLLTSMSWVSALAEPFQKILNNGDPLNRIDIAVLGDGYTASELERYQSDVQNFLNGFFGQEPFREYQRYFNVHRIDVISNQSGADHPAMGIFVDTALDATYGCGGVERLICVDNTKVNTILYNTLNASQHDVTLVLVNDPEYGGSGGQPAVASTNEAVIELVLHEEGHSFGLLGDEYGGPPPPVCDKSSEPSWPNVTKQSSRTLVKWARWIDPLTPIPTTSTVAGIPGLYLGAGYCDSGLYRPTYNSKMRSLGKPYEQINVEQLVRRIYNYVSPIDSSSPATSNITLSNGQLQTFVVSTPAPLTHILNVSWLVDDQQKATGATFVFDSSRLGNGVHNVAAVANDPTLLVRSDPNHVLTAVRNWTVNVSPTAPGQIGNLSTRMNVGTGGNVLIGGFIVQGTSPKKILIRAQGLSLPSSVGTRITNPSIELHDPQQQNQVIARNDDWQTTQIGGVITADQAADIQNSALAPGDPKESAMIVTLNPGVYTAIVQGPNGETGVGIVEAYDVDPTSSSSLTNISTRGQVQTGGNVMIGGFIVRGTAPKKVLIRAQGPSLPSSVGTRITNPSIELHDPQQQNQVIARNDDWQTTQIGGVITADQAVDIQNSTFAPGGPKESAMIVTLPPGVYTAIVQGPNGETGVGIVEIYSLDN